jgi:hypothetical protein
MKLAVLVMSFAVAPALYGQTALIAKAASAWTEADADAAINAASHEAPASAELVSGIVHHNLAVQNPSRWLARAIIELEKCAKSGDPIASAYYGSALTVRAGALAAKGDQMGATADLDRGFALIDAAVRAMPGSLLLRLMRAENSVSTSEQSPFPRWSVAEEDISAVEASGAALSPEDRANLETLKARIALGRGDADSALRHLEAAIRTAPGSRAAAAARRLISDFED